MKIKIIEIGKTQSKDWQALIDEYIKRANKYSTVELITLNPKCNKTEINAVRDFEGKHLISFLADSKQNVVLLDEKGKEFSSVGFSQYIQKHQLSGKKELCFVIGGAYGFSEEVRTLYRETIALSQMTFTHQMIRLIFAEQLYRSFTILANEKYHH